MSAHLRASPPERYEAISRRLLTQARQELDQGEILQASEKVWGAAAHAIKAVCQRMNWNHHAHHHITAAANYIATELGRDDLRLAFGYLESLHANWYEHQRSADEIRTGINAAAQLTAELYGLSLPSQPGSQSPLSPTEMDDQERRLRMLARKTQYSHARQLQGDALAGLPPIDPTLANNGENNAG